MSISGRLKRIVASKPPPRRLTSTMASSADHFPPKQSYGAAARNKNDVRERAADVHAHSVLLSCWQKRTSFKLADSLTSLA